MLRLSNWGKKKKNHFSVFKIIGNPSPEFQNSAVAPFPHACTDVIESLISGQWRQRGARSRCIKSNRLKANQCFISSPVLSPPQTGFFPLIPLFSHVKHREMDKNWAPGSLHWAPGDWTDSVTRPISKYDSVNAVTEILTRWRYSAFVGFLKIETRSYNTYIYYFILYLFLFFSYFLTLITFWMPFIF